MSMEWECVVCGAGVPDTYDVCWQCQASREGTLPETGQPGSAKPSQGHRQCKVTSCCKCQSEKMIRLDSKNLSYWWSDRDLGSDDLTLVLSDGFFPRNIHLEWYICTACGYTEQYVRDWDDRNWLWQRADVFSDRPKES